MSVLMNSQTRKSWDRLVDNAVGGRANNFLHSPAPIRAWVYCSLLAEYRLFHTYENAAMNDAVPDEKPTPRAYLTRLRLALGPYTIHFTDPGYIKDDTMRMLESNVCRKTLEESRRNFELR
jgi:palmitoyltransferase